MGDRREISCKVSMYVLSLSLSFSVSRPNPVLYVLACSEIRAAVHPLHYFWNHGAFLSHRIQSGIVHLKKKVYSTIEKFIIIIISRDF